MSWPLVLLAAGLVWWFGPAFVPILLGGLVLGAVFTELTP